MYRKRERTQNWSLEEKMYLLELVRSRLDVLENKRIDSASSTMKGLAWQDIHAGFAARFGPDRDAHRVREQWRRMKGQARTEMVEFAERVRNYGPEVANQRRPSVLAEDVWKTLELARKVNMYRQPYSSQGGGRGGADDTGSGEAEDLDDGDGDVWNPIEADVSFLSDFSPSGQAGDHDSLLENGVRTKREPEDNSGDGEGSQPREDFDGEAREGEGDRERDRAASHGGGTGASDDENRDDEDDEDHMVRFPRDMLPNSRSQQARPSSASVPSNARQRAESGVSGSTGVTSHNVPTGFVNLLRPKVELSYNNDSDVPDIDTSMVPSGLSITAVRTLGNSLKRRAVQLDNPSSTTAAGAGQRAAATSTSATEERLVRSTLLEMKRDEQRRRAEMLEAEHRAKMEILRVERATAEIRRRIALLDEARALGRDGVLSPGTPATPRTATRTPSPAQAPTPPGDDIVVLANGINGKTDDSPHEDGDDQKEQE